MKKTGAANTPTLEVPDLDELSRLFVEAFPPLSVDDQKLSLELYRLLLEGAPVALDQLARTAGISSEMVHQTLGQWPGVFYDDSHRVIGFWGLSVAQSRHRFQVGRKIAYTWCAWDTLFIPELLNVTANVSSTCAATSETIRLTVSPVEVEAAEPRDVVVSFLTPSLDELRKDVTTSFCRFVHFFRSLNDGQAWRSNHSATFLLSLEEAFSVGKKKNAARFKEVLGNN